MTSSKSNDPVAVDEVSVTFARPWTVNGTEYKPDQTAKVSRGDADYLVGMGYARPADQKVN